jgi:hypothetical protein
VTVRTCSGVAVPERDRQRRRRQALHSLLALIAADRSGFPIGSSCASFQLGEGRYAALWWQRTCDGSGRFRVLTRSGCARLAVQCHFSKSGSFNICNKLDGTIQSGPSSCAITFASSTANPVTNRTPRNLARHTNRPSLSFRSNR